MDVFPVNNLISIQQQQKVTYLVRSIVIPLSNVYRRTSYIGYLGSILSLNFHFFSKLFRNDEENTK
jgi:hypothetical protein